MGRVIAWLAASGPDALEIALNEVGVAIAMVGLGYAVTVRLCGLMAADAASTSGAARAQAAGVDFRVLRDARGQVDLIVGPRLGPVALESSR